MGIGKRDEARELLKEAQKIYKNHLWAKVMMGA